MRRFIAAFLLCAAVPPASAQVAEFKPQAPGVFRMRLGDFQVTALSDGAAPLDPHAVANNRTRAQIDAALARADPADPVEPSVNAYLIGTGTRLVLVDAGAGRLFGPTRSTTS